MQAGTQQVTAYDPTTGSTAAPQNSGHPTVTLPADPTGFPIDPRLLTTRGTMTAPPLPHPNPAAPLGRPDSSLGGGSAELAILVAEQSTELE